ncbi:MAG: hypothetical protein ACE5JX_06185 [Acidobacteriota bacterium]
MSDDLKSAWEIALEKLESKGAAEIRKLTPEQKKSIARTRGKYQALIAEQEISIQSSVQKALQSGAPEKVEELQKRLWAEKRRLEARMEAEIEEIRQGP